MHAPDIVFVLSRMISFVLLVFSFSILKNRKIYASMIKKISDSPLLLLLFGVINLILGMLIVFFYNQWSLSWTVLVTLIGWLLLIRGILYLGFPRLVAKIGKKLERNLRWMVPVSALFMAMYAFALLYFSYGGLI